MNSNSDLNLAGKEMIKPVIIFIFPFEMGSSYVTKVAPELLVSRSPPVSASCVAGSAGLHCGTSQPLILTKKKKKIVARGGLMSDRACSVRVLGPSSEDWGRA